MVSSQSIEYREPESNRHVPKGQGILSPLRLPIPPSRQFVEAASGFEPLNKGFADLCLSHLATPPIEERETGLEPATVTLAT